MEIPDLGILIKKVDIALTKEMNNFASQYDLTGVQMSIIDFLGRKQNNQATQQEIEREFNIQRSTTTIILQRMERRKLVLRSIDKSDRRKRYVKLQAKAIELFPIVNEYIAKHQKRLIEQFSIEELKNAVKVLNKIRENVNE